MDRLSTLVARCKCPYQKDCMHSYFSTSASNGRQILCGHQNFSGALIMIIYFSFNQKTCEFLNANVEIKFNVCYNLHWV